MGCGMGIYCHICGRQLNYEDEGGYDRENELCGECLIAIKRLMCVSEHESDDDFL